MIRPGAIGDLIVSLPALESLTVESTEVWVARPNIPLIRFASGVRAIETTGLDWLEVEPGRAPASLLASLREFESIITWYGANRDGFRHAVRQLGLPFQFLDALPREPGRHATDFYLEQARAMRGRPVEAAPRIECRQPPGDYIVIHPFSGSPAKNWPLTAFRELAAELNRRYPVEWTAGPSEPLDGARRFDDLYELGLWLAGARLYAGNDSGITHLAAAVGTPTLAIFGPTDPSVWAPRGPHVRVVTPGTPSASPSDLGVGPVLDAATALLD